jgi:hypothetical protein
MEHRVFRFLPKADKAGFLSQVQILDGKCKS